jgi:hypothetical protein
MTYTTNIRVWSKIGSTPITRRTGAFCDVLADVTITCETPAEARNAALYAIKATKHGDRAHFVMPDHPNQNLNSGWV